MHLILSESTYPAIDNLVQWNRIEIMQLASAFLYANHEIGLLEDSQMLAHRLPAHIQLFAEFIETLPIPLAQFVEKMTPTLIGEGFEYIAEMPSDAIAQLALRFLKLEEERRVLIKEVDRSDLASRTRIADLLGEAGIFNTMD